MPTQPAPPPPASRPPPKTAKPPPKTAQPPDAARSDPDAATPKPSEEGAIFRALLDAGTEATVAYNAEKRLYTMILEAVAPQLQPFRTEVRRQFDDVYRRFDDIDRRFEDVDRRLEALATAVAEHDRKLEVIVARLDGMRVLGQVILGALALLITALIAVFGILFTS